MDDGYQETVVWQSRTIDRLDSMNIKIFYLGAFLGKIKRIIKVIRSFSVNPKIHPINVFVIFVNKSFWKLDRR